jgi:hypothetical protein
MQEDVGEVGDGAGSRRARERLSRDLLATAILRPVCLPHQRGKKEVSSAGAVAGQEGDTASTLFFFFFSFFSNWADKWACCTRQQVYQFHCHVSLTGGPIMAVFVSIRDQFKISAHCKLSTNLSWFFAIEM